MGCCYSSPEEYVYATGDFVVVAQQSHSTKVFIRLQWITFTLSWTLLVLLKWCLCHNSSARRLEELRLKANFTLSSGQGGMASPHGSSWLRQRNLRGYGLCRTANNNVQSSQSGWHRCCHWRKASEHQLGIVSLLSFIELHLQVIQLILSRICVSKKIQNYFQSTALTDLFVTFSCRVILMYVILMSFTHLTMTFWESSQWCFIAFVPGQQHIMWIVDTVTICKSKRYLRKQEPMTFDRSPLSTDWK